MATEPNRNEQPYFKPSSLYKTREDCDRIGAVARKVRVDTEHFQGSVHCWLHQHTYGVDPAVCGVYFFLELTPKFPWPSAQPIVEDCVDTKYAFDVSGGLTVCYSKVDACDGTERPGPITLEVDNPEDAVLKKVAQVAHKIADYAEHRFTETAKETRSGH